MWARLSAVSLAVLASVSVGAVLPASAQPTARSTPSQAEPALVLTLRGTLTEDDHLSYRELPFEVPAGIGEIMVRFSYTHQGEGATVDLGLWSPTEFRGWSGGNKAAFRVGVETATPSYVPGPIEPGTWHLLLGVPNLRRGVRSVFEATVTFEPLAAGAALVESPLAPSPRAAPSANANDTRNVPRSEQARWYRGDLHLHSGHSDGACVVQGERIPCPLQRSLEAASTRHLDFVALTEHNTTSHHRPLRTLQDSYPELLIIPGREITTFQGHANVYGTNEFVEFRLGSEYLPDLDGLLRRTQELGALVSINHPALPTGSLCMGCGWSLEFDDPRIAAAEVLNGGAMGQRGGKALGLFSGIPFWERALNQGLSLVAIGGSDNHDPDLSLTETSAVGKPTTVVWASELSVAAILQGIRAGRVFIDLEPNADRVLDFSVASSQGPTAVMGGRMGAAVGEALRIVATVEGAAGSMLEVISNGFDIGDPGRVFRIESGKEQVTIEGVVVGAKDGNAAWVRLQLREQVDGDEPPGRVVALTNAVRLELR